MLNLLRWGPILVATLLMFPVLQPVAAAPVVLSPDQAEQLKRLPPAQRELLRKALREQASRGTPFDRANMLDAENDDGEGELDDDPLLKRGSAIDGSRQSDGTAQAPPRLQPGDTLLITFKAEEKPPETKDDADMEAALSAEEKAARDEELKAQEKLRKARLPTESLFVLDQFGAVTMNNVGRFVLAGLNEAEAAARLAVDPVFKGLRVRVKRLPLEPELKRFGHDLFTGVPKTFAPAVDIPVPVDYVVGPGDRVIVQLLGKENVEHEIVVTRDGMLLFPGLGPIAVAGMKFSQLQKELQNRVRRQFIGTQASVTLGRLRSIRVFVLGDVVRPGSYTVSSLSTLTNALFASGGVTPIGSLRDIQLKRNGAVVSRLDLYDLLLRGDTRGDARLLPGDVIFVPPVGPVVGVGGRVRRPAFYELREETSLAEVIDMAGGLLADAYPSGTRIERLLQGRSRAVLNVDLSQPDASRAPLQDGDVVRVFAIADQLEQSVRLTGWVAHAGAYEWKPGMRLSDLITSTAMLKREADTRYVLITREDGDDRRVEVIGADPMRALASRGSEADVALMPRDEVRVFGIHEDRATLIGPMLERARLSSSPSQPSAEVTIGGAVHHPGRYPWSPTMTVEDLIRAGGGLTERAHTLEAELTRYSVDAGKPRDQARQSIALSSAKAGAAEIALQPHDRLVVRGIPHWEEQGSVEILGEVRFPGRYPIFRGERLSQVIARAGGLSESAYSRAAVFLRESVRQRERDYLDQLVAQLERDLVVVKTEGPGIGVPKEAALSEGEALLRQMRAAKATGRMVVDLDAVMNARESYDVVVQAGDKLVIPQRPDDVTVIGEVYYPTSHVYTLDRGRNDYVRLSGGVNERGNKRAAYVVHADGSVSPPSGWFGGDVAVGPGDTIIVPVKVDRIGNLKLFTDVSTILFQLAVTAAALNSIGLF